MSFFGFGQSADIDIELDGADTRKLVEIKQEDGRKDRYYLYYDGETVSGKVNLNLKKSGSRLEHQGIKIEFVGQIELYYDRGNHHEFTSLVKELARPGELIHNTSYDFEFNQVEKPYESYTGTNVRLRYFLRVTVVRRISDIVREMDLIVYTLSSYPDSNNSIKMEVGIEDCLHIEFEYNKSGYHLKDVIVGKICFLLVRMKVKHMEIAIMKRETTGSGPNTFNENETIAKYEIMDGAPVRGESIPIRVFLAGYDLTPSMRDINKKFSVRYYLNLVLVDEEERRYFKQQEITLWRKGERVRRPLQEQLLAQQQAMQQLHLGHQAAAAAAAASTTSQYGGASEERDHRQHHQPGEVVPPLGAEPPSPHQSQSPMQEEIPPVPAHTTSSPSPFLQDTDTSALATTPSPLQQENANTNPDADNTAAAAVASLANNNNNTTSSSNFVSSNSVITNSSNSTPAANQPQEDAAAASANTVPSSNTTTSDSTSNRISAAVSAPPLAAPTTPPPLPLSSTSPPPLPVSSSTPPPLPVVSTTPPPIEDGEVINGGVVAAEESKDEITDTPEKTVPSANIMSSSDVPPLVCSTEPPALPSPPTTPLESPGDEDEFMEASAASPTPTNPRQQQKKEAVALAQ